MDPSRTEVLTRSLSGAVGEPTATPTGNRGGQGRNGTATTGSGQGGRATTTAGAAVAKLGVQGSVLLGGAVGMGVFFVAL